jgi:Right handed beta helix region
MKHIGKFTAILGAAAFFAGVYAAPASAQATRTWVSGVGDDANPCSRTAPCKTFAGAISKTATGGEINCLDPGGFGGVTITKSLSIVCQYTEGGILSAGAGVNGIIVNATATSHIYLRGLDLHGAGNAQNGLRILAAGSVTLEDSVIRAYNASSGLGISFQPSGSTLLTISNTTISNNGAAGSGGGILIQPTGVGGTARVVMDEVRIVGNQNFGLSVNTTGSTSGQGITVAINESQISGNANGGISIVQPGGTQVVTMTVDDSTVAANIGTGIASAGGGAVVRVANTEITGNSTGVSATSGGSIFSYGDNRLDGNPSVGAPNDGTFTGAVLPKK